MSMLDHRTVDGLDRWLRYGAPMVPRADAIVVLGCAVGSNGEPSAALARRLDLAYRAFTEGLAPVVLCSGGRRWAGQYVEATVMKERLVARGVPEQAIMVERRSRSTVENAGWSSQMLRHRGSRRVLVASCAWHLPRAMHNFRRFGIEPIAPEAAWLVTQRAPRASLITRMRERVCGKLDALRAAQMQWMRPVLRGGWT